MINGRVIVPEIAREVLIKLGQISEWWRRVRKIAMQLEIEEEVNVNMSVAETAIMKKVVRVRNK